MSQKRTAFFVSDRTGLTVEKLGRSLLSQFEGIEFARITLPFVDSEDKAREAVKRINQSAQADGQRPIVFSTLIVPEIHDIIEECDALILDPQSASDTVPYMEINEKKVSIGHEASVGKVSEEQLFYLMSRGLGEEQAMTMIVSGFIEPFTKELPVEYAVELNRLIALSMEGSVG